MSNEEVEQSPTCSLPPACENSTVHFLLTNWLCYGEWQNRGYQNFETPEATVTKCGTDDYVGDITPHAKIQSDRPSAGDQANE